MRSSSLTSTTASIYASTRSTAQKLSGNPSTLRRSHVERLYAYPRSIWRVPSLYYCLKFAISLQSQYYVLSITLTILPVVALLIVLWKPGNKLASFELILLVLGMVLFEQSASRSFGLYFSPSSCIHFRDAFFMITLVKSRLHLWCTLNLIMLGPTQLRDRGSL